MTRHFSNEANATMRPLIGSRAKFPLSSNVDKPTLPLSPKRTRVALVFLTLDLKNPPPLTVNTVLTTVNKANIHIEFTCPNNSVYGLVDSKLLERAIGNMLSNAVKYTPKGRTIRATLVRKQSMLYLTVSDSGEGFDDSIRGNLFTQFHREPGIEDGRKGLGLGLQLIRSAASAHGGTVLIHDSGNGSRITMSMAIRQDRNGSLRSKPANWTDPNSHDRSLIELADVLPTSAFHPNELV